MVRVIDVQPKKNQCTTRRAVFLDRDGVLIRDTGYPHTITKVLWVRDAVKAVSMFNERNFLVFVVTNQSGVARGFFSEEQVRRLHAEMNSILECNGARIEAWRYCPHHPSAIATTYRKSCDCRKPSPGMPLDLIRIYGLDKENCLMIGDRESDLQCANNAGIKGFKFAGAETDHSLFKFCCDVLDEIG